MNNVKKIGLFLILVLTVVSCGGKTVKVSDNDLGKIVKASNKFGFKLFKKLNSGNDNVFISPTSIYTALTMALNGATGKTYEEMASILNVDAMNLKQVNTLNLSLLNKLDELNPGVKLKIANSMWIDKKIKVNDQFIDNGKEYFNSEIKNVRLDGSAVAKINSWVSDKTDGMIKKLLQSLPCAAAVVLLNAIFFHGKWKIPFKEKFTKKSPFNLPNGRRIRHPIMFQSEKTPYYETGDFQAIRLDYGEKRKAGIVILLPKEGKSINNVYEKILENGLTSIKFRKKKGRIYLPKFKVSYGAKSLKDALKSLGMKTGFTTNASFRNLSKSTGLMIDDVLHKAVIDLNEKGTKAAAATAIVFKRTSFSGKRPFVFNANRPFLYFIRDNETGLVLFMGVLNSPGL